VSVCVCVCVCVCVLLCDAESLRARAWRGGHGGVASKSRNKACQARSAELDAVVPSLPKVSVILCFFNEEWFALLRSVWGVILTSPPELVDEILLVDDGSTMHHLHGLLEE
jgi:hypothetical protein